MGDIATVFSSRTRSRERDVCTPSKYTLEYVVIGNLCSSISFKDFLLHENTSKEKSLRTFQRIIDWFMESWTITMFLKFPDLFTFSFICIQLLIMKCGQMWPKLRSAIVAAFCFRSSDKKEKLYRKISITKMRCETKSQTHKSHLWGSVYPKIQTKIVRPIWKISQNQINSYCSHTITYTDTHTQTHRDTNACRDCNEMAF